MDRKNLAIDAVALAVCLVALNPALTGIGLHEWIGLGLFAVFVVHVALHVDWVADAFHTARANPSIVRTGNLVLDVLVLAAFVACTASGLMVSGDVLRAFGWYAQGYYFWDPLHAASAKVLLALLLVHVVVHWRWVAQALRRNAGPRKRGGSSDGPGESTAK